MFPRLSRYTLAYPVMLLGLVAPKLKEVTGSRDDQKQRVSLASVHSVPARPVRITD